MPSERVTEENFNIVLELPYDISEEQYKVNEEWIKGAFKDYPAIKVEVSKLWQWKEVQETRPGSGLAWQKGLRPAVQSIKMVECPVQTAPIHRRCRSASTNQGSWQPVVGIIRAELFVGHADIEGSNNTKRACGRTLESIAGRNTSRAALPLVFNLRKSPLPLEVALELDAYSRSISKHKPGFEKPLSQHGRRSHATYVVPCAGTDHYIQVLKHTNLLSVVEGPASHGQAPQPPHRGWHLQGDLSGPHLGHCSNAC
eukprot:4234773-Amphidinium_carterae.1